MAQCVPRVSNHQRDGVCPQLLTAKTYGFFISVASLAIRGVGLVEVLAWRLLPLILERTARCLVFELVCLPLRFIGLFSLLCDANIISQFDQGNDGLLCGCPNATRN